MTPEFGTRCECKQWALLNVWPQRKMEKLYVIRRLEDGYYYTSRVISGVDWVFRLDHPMVEHFDSIKRARRRLPSWLWWGNWLSKMFGEWRWPRPIYEIVEVYVVCEVEPTAFPEVKIEFRRVI